MMAKEAINEHLAAAAATARLNKKKEKTQTRNHAATKKDSSIRNAA